MQVMQEVCGVPLLFYSLLPIEQVRRLDSFQEVILIVSKRYEDRIKEVRHGVQPPVVHKH